MSVLIPTAHAYQQSVDLPVVALPIINVGVFIRFNKSSSIITNIISAFLPAILGIAGFLTVIIIVISGIQFITSSGNPEAATAARGRLTFALVGFVLIVLAFAITQIIDRLFLGGTGVV